MELINNCPLCGAKEGSAHFLECADYLLATGQYSMVTCGSCRHVYTNPRPFANELDKYYQAPAYISHNEQAQSFQQQLYFKVQAFMLGQKQKLIGRLKLPNKNLLDVGCGAGAFLKKMKNADLQCFGFEPNDQARETARKKGLHVLENQEDILKLGPGFFGMITLWHVLEHQPHFMQNLQHYYKLLAPGGWLLVAVPMHQSFDASFYGKYWAAYDLPRHLHHFSPATLNLAAQKNGFVLRQTRGMFFDAFYVALLSEKHKGTRLGAIRALCAGAWSNLLGILKIKPWSSQIFVFQKPF